MSILSEDFAVPVLVPAEIKPISITPECSRVQLPLIFREITKLASVDVENWTFSTAYKLIQYAAFLGKKHIPNICKYFEDFGVRDNVNKILKSPLYKNYLINQVNLEFILEATHTAGYHSFSQETYITRFKFTNISFSLGFNCGDNEFILTPMPTFDDEFIGACRRGEIPCVLTFEHDNDFLL